MSQPFARAIAMMASIQVLIAKGMNDFSSIGPYKSRGKGRGTPARSFIRSRSKYTPHYGAKEAKKHSERQHMVIVNGFQIMQTWRSCDRLMAF